MNKEILRYSAILAISLTSCTSISKLDRMSISGNDFNSSLAQNYRSLANYEANQDDWVSAYRYANKGLASVKGKEVLPTNISKCMNAANKAELIEGRAQLVSFLTENNKMNMPKRTADAQAYFDCWVEESNEGWQIDRINLCKNGFVSSLTDGGTGGGITSNDHIIYFGLNSTHLGGYDQKIIANLAKNIKHQGIKLVKVKGYADTTGSKQYNYKISQKRAEVVKGALVKHGVQNKLVKTEAFGQSNLAIPTADNIAEKRNRRVEIDIVK
ncbi:Outer membrane protein [Rickettsiales bacterium Ac37b]|nr:Outer membrane protein [Rickettsiales bacterium Ac37b]